MHPTTKKIRAKKNVTQKVWAKQNGFDPNYVTMVITGKSPHDWGIGKEIYDALVDQGLWVAKAKGKKASGQTVINEEPAPGGR